MSPIEMSNDQLIQFVRDGQMRRNLRQGLPDNSTGLERLRQRRLDQDNEIALREAEAELARRRSAGIVTDNQLILREVDLNSLIQAVENQAARNAERSIELERRLNPEAFQARTAGQNALAELATRGGVGTEQRRLLEQAIRNAAIVSPTIPLDQVSVPRIGVENVVLPQRPVAPQQAPLPALPTERVAVPAGPSVAEVRLPDTLPTLERVNPSVVGTIPTERVGNVTVPNPVLADRVEIGAAVSPERTEIQVSDLQRQVEQKALDDLALGGQLSAEERAEVIRAALASAGAAGVTGGTARDITARDLGLSSMALQRERAERARQVGLTTEERNARQAQLDAQRQAQIAEQQNLNARLQAQLDAARAQFNAGLINQAQLQQVENNVRIALQNAAEANQNARFSASLADQAARFNAEAANQAAMTAYNAAIQAGFTNAEAQNRANMAFFDARRQAALQNASEANQNARFMASLMDARDRFNAGLQSQYAMAAYEAAVRAGFTNAEALNSALRAEAAMLMNARESERDRQFRSEQAALDRSQQAIRDALSSLQDNDRIRLSAAQIASSIPRPVSGLDPSSVADILISQVNQQNQLAFQNEAIRRQQQSANMAANALNSQLNTRPRLTTTTQPSLTVTPVSQTIGARTQEVQDWYRRNPLPSSRAQTPSQLSRTATLPPPRI